MYLVWLRGGDEIKPKRTQKEAKLHFLRLPKHLQGGKIAKFKNMQISLASGPSDNSFSKKVYYRTLELLG
jgi:hypothetical protein